MPTESPDPTAGPAQPRPAEAQRPLLRLLGMTRLIILVPVICIFAAATALMIYGAVETYAMIVGVLRAADRHALIEELIFGSIELVDLFLLATVLYVTAVGLYELFVDSDVPVPAWLRIDDIDDLKHKLIGVVITVLGIVFLGQVLTWDGTRNLLPLGVGIGAVVVALSYFLSIHSDKDGPPDGH